MGLHDKTEEKTDAAAAPGPKTSPAPAAPLTLADKIRKLGAEREVDAGIIGILLEMAQKLETLGLSLGR